jgi:transposase
VPIVETVYAENIELKTQVVAQKQRIAQLEAQIEWLRKKMFGTGKSEKSNPGQMELLLETLEAAKAQVAPVQEITYERKAPQARRSREELYENLPVLEEVVIEPEPVKAEPEAFEEIGREETFEVDIRPPVFFRRRIIRPKYRRKEDRTLAPVVAAAPARIVEGIASAGLLSHIVISKFMDHLPLYRQCAMFKRYGFSIERQTLVRWVERAAQWLEPIYTQMGEELLSGGYIQADETPVNYCDPDYGENKARRGYLCGYSKPGGNVYYIWSPSRSTEAITRFLKPFCGILQSDAYEAYIRFAREHENVELAGCWAHARRKFFECQERHPRECQLVLKLIGKLYHVEKQIREGLSDQAVELRNTESAKIHRWIYRLLLLLRQRHLPQSELAKACNYALNNWPHLSTYLKHPHVAIDNNAMENAIRPTAIGKKNWLFVGHPQAGNRAAILYSVLISCQRLGLDLRAYLLDLFSKDTRILSKSQIAALTPANWLASRS